MHRNIASIFFQKTSGTILVLQFLKSPRRFCILTHTLYIDIFFTNHQHIVFTFLQKPLGQFWFCNFLKVKDDFVFSVFQNPKTILFFSSHTIYRYFFNKIINILYLYFIKTSGTILFFQFFKTQRRFCIFNHIKKRPAIFDKSLAHYFCKHPIKSSISKLSAFAINSACFFCKSALLMPAPKCGLLSHASFSCK